MRHYTMLEVVILVLAVAICISMVAIGCQMPLR
jgi:hypothetical protein